MSPTLATYLKRSSNLQLCVKFLKNNCKCFEGIDHFVTEIWSFYPPTEDFCLSIQNKWSYRVNFFNTFFDRLLSIFLPNFFIIICVLLKILSLTVGPKISRAISWTLLYLMQNALLRLNKVILHALIKEVLIKEFS